MARTHLLAWLDLLQFTLRHWFTAGTDDDDHARVDVLHDHWKGLPK